MQNLETTIAQLKTMKEIPVAKNLLKTYEKYASKVQEYDFIARLQNEVKDYESSIANLKKSLSISTNPNEMYAIRANIAKMYNHLNEPLKSIAYSNANLVVKSDDFDSKMEIGFSHYLNGDYEKGETLMRNLLLEPNVPEDIKNRIAYNLASYDIEAGKFKQGMLGHVKVGHEIGILPIEEIPMIPKWDGAIEAGRTVIILAEGGIGDEIIQVRFMKNLERLGMTAIWVTKNKHLVEVFNRNGFKTVQNLEGIDTSNAVQVQSFWLPVLLDLDAHQVWEGPYLKPSQQYIDKWNKILPEGKKTAFKWFGNKEYDQDLHRSVPYEKMLDIFNCGINVSLQLEGCGPEMFDAGSLINSIEDTLAIISLCDKTISSCTSVVHMAGSMSCDCIVLPPIACYHIWLGRTDEMSNWYQENLKVVRQTKHRNWDTVIERVNEIQNGTEQLQK